MDVSFILRNHDVLGTVKGGDREAAGWVGENSVVSELGRVDDFGAQDAVG